MTRIRTLAFFIGILAMLVSVLGATFQTAQFFRSYLFAYVFWLGLALGGFGLTMLHQLVGGRWGFATRRFFEAGLMTLPLMAALVVPLFFGLGKIYGWANRQIVFSNEVLRHRHVYLNAPFFIIRMVIWFAIWLWLARVLLRGARAQDHTSDPEPTRRLRTFSGPGVVIYVFSASFAFIDLVLSLEPDWYSTIFLILIVIGQTLAMLSLGIILLRIFAARAPFSEMVTPQFFHDLGNLLLAFVMLWAYMAFSQLLIIWSGNLPAEISWYLHRCYGGWKTVALLLGLFHFAVPFALLLSRDLKRRIDLLCGIAALVFVAHIVDVYWLVMPSFLTNAAHPAVHLHWLDLTVFIGIGGFWVALFLFNLARFPLVPLNDPRLVKMPVAPRSTRSDFSATTT